MITTAPFKLFQIDYMKSKVMQNYFPMESISCSKQYVPVLPLNMSWCEIGPDRINLQVK